MQNCRVIKLFIFGTGSQGEPMGALNRIVNETHPDVFLECKDAVIFFLKNDTR